MKNVLLAIVTMAAFVGNVRADVSFFDGDFDSADWISTLQFGNGTLSANQVITGGNPGDYLRVDHQNFTGDFVAYHFCSEAMYDPGLASIQRIEWSQDEKAIQNLYGIGVAVSLAIEQDGIKYSAFPQFVNSSSS